MSPISRLFSRLVDLLTNAVASVSNMFERMDMIQFATISICALIVAGLCLRGNPVRGA